MLRFKSYGVCVDLYANTNVSKHLTAASFRVARVNYPSTDLQMEAGSSLQFVAPIRQSEGAMLQTAGILIPLHIITW